MLLNEYFDLISKCQIFTGPRALNISRYLGSVLNLFKKSILKMGSSSHSHSFDLFPVPSGEILPKTIHPLPLDSLHKHINNSLSRVQNSTKYFFHWLGQWSCCFPLTFVWERTLNSLNMAKIWYKFPGGKAQWRKARR